MTLHISHIPLLYCLLYHRTGCWRSRDMVVALGMFSSDSRSVDIDSADRDHYLFHESSTYRGGLSSGEEQDDWTSTYLSENHHKQKKSKPHQNSYSNKYDNNNNLIRPYRHLPVHNHREYRHRHGSHRDNNKRGKQERHGLCSALNIIWRLSPTHHHRERTHSSTRSRFYRSDDHQCSFNNQADVQRLLPGRFISHRELDEILPRLPHSVGKDSSLGHRQGDALVDNSKMAAQSLKHESLKQETPEAVACGACFTEIGYEVFQEITDLKGVSHQVINFNNAFQFIPVGRCKNELSVCGGGQGASCRQAYRAHWTFVFSQASGAQLVAHEVPSHCECMNIGAHGSATGQEQGSVLSV